MVIIAETFSMLIGGVCNNIVIHFLEMYYLRQGNAGVTKLVLAVILCRCL